MYSSSYQGHAITSVTWVRLLSDGSLNRGLEHQRGLQHRSHFKITSALYGNALLIKMAVEILESKSDPRYKYFNAKIQSLVKKRIILEEMQRATMKNV